MTANKIRLIVQKKKTLDDQIHKLQIVFDNNEVDNDMLKLSLERLTKLYNTYEDLNDQLAVLSPSHNTLLEFDELQNKFYILTTQINRKLNLSVPVQAQQGHREINSNINAQRVTLPVANIPVFDGNYEKWLAFRNIFLTMIDARDNLNDLEKFLYLQSSLSGDALNKISIYEPSAANYKLAWDALTCAYEKKYIIITRHLSALLKLQEIIKISHDSLVKFCDEMQQHVAILKSLNVCVGNEMLVQIIFDKIPRFLVEKVQENFGTDKFPDVTAVFKFLSEFAFLISERERAGSSKKREREGKSDHPNKTIKNDKGARVFLTDTPKNCVICKDSQHPLHMCTAFKTLPLPDRWNVVKENKLCVNCLRKHIGKCKFSNCKMCNKYHNSLLHNPKIKSNAAVTSEIKPTPTQTS